MLPDASTEVRERAAETRRCVLHIDLDGFYAQVESKRLGLTADQPLGVVQWSSLIAVNYAAKRAGVKRGTTAEEASKLCPGVVLAHVETVDASGASSTDRDGAGPRPEKVSLERYRIASQGVFRAFAGVVDASLIEKASIDEAFVDATALAPAWADGEPAACRAPAANEAAAPGDTADDEAAAPGGTAAKRQCDEEASARGGAAKRARGADGDAAAPGLPDDWVVVGRSAGTAVPIDAEAWRPEERDGDRLLLGGMRLAAALRAAVLRDCGFTCSAGVAHNKLLSKFASAMHKPDRQTCVPSGAVLPLLRGVPLGKLRGMGAKLGARVEAVVAGATGRPAPAAGGGWRAWGAASEPRGCTAEEAQCVPAATLVATLGEQTGVWVWRRCRGLDSDPVEARTASKSLLAAKSFAGAATEAELRGWTELVCAELAPRLARDRDEQSREPATVTVHWRAAGVRGEQMRAASVRAPASLQACVAAAVAAGPDDADARRAVAAALVDAAGLGLRRCVERGGLPCNRVAVSVSGFRPVSRPGTSIADKLRRLAERRVPARPAAASTGDGADTAKRRAPNGRRPASRAGETAEPCDAVGALRPAPATLRSPGPDAGRASVELVDSQSPLHPSERTTGDPGTSSHRAGAAQAGPLDRFAVAGARAAPASRAEKHRRASAAGGPLLTLRNFFDRVG